MGEGRVDGGQRVESVRPVGGRNLCTVSAEVPCGVLAPGLQSRTVSQDTGTGWRPPGKGRARLTEIGMSMKLESSAPCSYTIKANLDPSGEVCG